MTLYSSLEALELAFEAKCPDITMVYVRGTDADPIPKFEVENQTGNAVADVHMTTDAGRMDRRLESDQYSEPVVAPGVEAADHQLEDTVLDDTIVMTSTTSIGLAWNTEEVPQGLDTPQDRPDPRFDGRVGVGTPACYPGGRPYLQAWRVRMS